MPEIPSAYASWLPLLDRFREGDDAALDLMRQGSIEWSNVVAQRWTQHVTAAFEGRLQAISKQLQLGLNRSSGDAFALARSLLDARHALQPLRAFISLPSLPEEVRNHLQSELERWATQTQDRLEKGAQEIRADNGRLLKIIRDNSLAARAETSPPAATEIDDAPPRRGRRIIL